MKKNTTFALGFISTLASGMINAATPGFYVGANYGQSVGPEKTMISGSNFGSPTGGSITGQDTDIYNFDTRNSALYGLLLGYNFNRYFGAEVNYTNLGAQNLTSFSGGITKNFGFDGVLKSSLYGFSFVGYLPIKKKINFYAKLGLANLYTNAVFNDPNGVVFSIPNKYKISTNGTALTYGVGAQYAFSSHISGRLEWGRISRFDNVKIGNISYNQFLAGLIYSFCS